MSWRASLRAYPNRVSFERLRSPRADAPRRQRDHDGRRHEKTNIIREIAELRIRACEWPGVPGLVPKRQRGGQPDNPRIQAVTHARPVFELFRRHALPPALQ